MKKITICKCEIRESIGDWKEYFANHCWYVQERLLYKVVQMLFLSEEKCFTVHLQHHHRII